MVYSTLNSVSLWTPICYNTQSDWRSCCLIGSCQAFKVLGQVHTMPFTRKFYKYRWTIYSILPSLKELNKTMRHAVIHNNLLIYLVVRLISAAGALFFYG